MAKNLQRHTFMRFHDRRKTASAYEEKWHKCSWVWRKSRNFVAKRKMVMTMQPLNLPPFEANIKKMDGMVKILDVLRRRFVALTPEEWVRQHFVHFLIGHKGYSPTLMANEVAVTLNGMSRRCDTVVYRQEELKPLMIVEYKRPDVNITQKVFDQICRYNMVLEVEYLVVSNGLRHYCCRIDLQGGTYTFLEDIPTFAEL